MRLSELMRGAALPLFEGEGTGSGSGTGTGTGTGTGSGTGNGTGTGTGVAWTPPAGFPEAFKGATAEEAMGKLLGGYTEAEKRATGLRTELARVPKAPEKPEAYTFKPSEKIAGYFGDDNKSLDFARKAFHKAGVPDTAFQGIIEDIYGPMVDAGLIPAPYNATKEIETFGTAMGLGKDPQVLSAALTETLSFAKGLTSQLKGIPESLKKEADAQLLSMTDSAGGNALLRAMAARFSEAGIRVAGDSAQQGGPLSPADLKKLAADPRIDPKNRDHSDPAKRFDPALRARFDEGYKAAGRPK